MDHASEENAPKLNSSNNYSVDGPIPKANPRFRKGAIKFAVCLLHATWMLLLSNFWTSLNLNLEIEENLVRWASIIKRDTFISHFYNNEVPIDQYSFIDVSGAKMLIDSDDSKGNSVVTDRDILDSLFRIVKKYPMGHKFILCDIFFENKTENDKALSSTLAHIPNIIFPALYVGDSVMAPVLSNLPSAYSGYNSSSGIGLTDKFLKFSLIESDTIVGLPLMMYVAMHGGSAKKKFGLVWVNDRPAINTLILDIRIPAADLEDEEGFSKVVPIGEILSLNNDSLIFDLFIKDKIVVIGDFENDLHNSIYGNIAGALLLVNIFEAIRQGDIYLKPGLLALILFGYALLSYIIFYYEGGMLENKIKKFSYPLIGSLGTRFLGFSFGLYGLSIMSYFIFGVHLDILAMATYLSVTSLVTRIIQSQTRIVRSFNVNY